MKITADERVAGGGCVGQFVDYFSIDGENNIAHKVNWFDPDTNKVGMIVDQELIVAIGRNKRIGDSYIETIQVDDIEWGTVITE